MKNVSNIKTQKSSPLVNIAIAAILLFTALPITLFCVAQVFPPLSNSATKTETVEDAASKRLSVAERRARRKEAREAKKSLAKNKNTPNKGESPMLYHLRMEERYVNPYLLGYDIERMFPGVDMNSFGPGGDMGRFAP